MISVCPKRIVSRARQLVLMVCAGVAVATLCVAATVCSKCGYEVAEEARQCAHCRQPVAGAVVPEAEATPPPAPAAVQVASPIVGIVGADIAQAKRHYHAGDVAVARLYCQNALALNYLTPANAGREARAAQILTYVEACAPAAGPVKRSCSVCQGRGRISRAGGGIAGSGLSGGRTCRACGGSGKVTGQETAEEVMLRIGEGARRFKAAQQSDLRVRIGRVWVPQQEAAALSVRQQVELKRAWPPGCEECGELGRLVCRDCDGGGTEECPAKGCEEGSVKRRETSGLAGERTVRMVTCTTCAGSGRAICEPCKGSGSRICTECQGRGEAPSCRRCAGAGMETCRRCKSTGSYRGESCPACLGEGEEVCGSCSGFGRES